MPGRLTILSGLKHTRESACAGGTVLDPANGKTHDARVTVFDGGKELEIRGSLLFIGRTQAWLRAD